MCTVSAVFLGYSHSRAHTQAHSATRNRIHDPKHTHTICSYTKKTKLFFFFLWWSEFVFVRHFHHSIIVILFKLNLVIWCVRMARRDRYTMNCNIKSIVVVVALCVPFKWRTNKTKKNSKKRSMNEDRRNKKFPRKSVCTKKKKKAKTTHTIAIDRSFERGARIKRLHLIDIYLHFIYDCKMLGAYMYKYSLVGYITRQAPHMFIFEKKIRIN